MKKYIVAIGLLVLPLTVLPDSVENCEDPTWQFNTVSNTEEYTAAAQLARSEFCRVVADDLEMYR